MNASREERVAHFANLLMAPDLYECFASQPALTTLVVSGIKVTCDILRRDPDFMEIVRDVSKQMVRHPWKNDIVPEPIDRLCKVLDAELDSLNSVEALASACLALGGHISREWFKREQIASQVKAVQLMESHKQLWQQKEICWRAIN